MIDGWVKMDRDILEWEWYDDTNTKSVFIHCLLRANFKDTKWRGKEIKRGEFYTSIATLVREINLSPRKIRTSLKKLEDTGYISTKSDKRGTLIRVNNYTERQDSNTSKGQIIDKVKSNKGKTNVNSIRKKEGKKERENNVEIYNKILEDFDLPISMEKAIKDWMKYKTDNGQPYKEFALKTFIKKLLELSNKDPVIATKIIEQSIANNYKGIFKLKNHTYENNKTNKQQELKRGKQELLNRITANEVK